MKALRTPWLPPERTQLRGIDEVFHPRSVLRQLRLALALALFGVALGIAFVILRPKVYTSEVRILLESQSAAGRAMLAIERQSIGLEGELDLIASETDQLLMQRARLLAERAGETDFELPPALQARAGDPFVQRLRAEETAILRANLRTAEQRFNRLEEQIRSGNEEIASLDRQIASKTEQLAILGVERQRMQELVNRQLTPFTRLLAVQRDAANVESDISDLERQKTRARGIVSASRLDVDTLKVETAGRIVNDLAEAEKRLEQLRTRRQTAAQQLDRQTGLTGDPLDPLFIRNQVELLGSDLVVGRTFEAVFLEGAGAVTSGIVGEMERLEALEEFRENLSTGLIERSSVLRAAFSGPSTQVAVDVVQRLTDTYLDTFRQLGQSSASDGGETAATVRVIKGPTIPLYADGPGDKSILAAAVVFAFMLGIAGALAREFFETRLRTRQDVERAVGVDCLGLIPRTAASRAEERSVEHAPRSFGDDLALEPAFPTLEIDDPSSTTTLTVRRVLADIVGIPPHRGVVVGITSARPGEGKTSLATSLLRLAARDRRRVLLVDAGIGPPKARAYGDLAGLVEGRVALPDGVAPGWSGDIVSVPRDASGIPVGDLLSRDLGPFLKAARQAYDVVVFDLPAMTPRADVRSMVGWLDGLFLVVEWRRTTIDAVRHGFTMAGGGTGMPLVAAIFNKVDVGAYRRLLEVGDDLRG